MLQLKAIPDGAGAVRPTTSPEGRPRHSTGAAMGYGGRRDPRRFRRSRGVLLPNPLCLAEMPFSSRLTYPPHREMPPDSSRYRPMAKDSYSKRGRLEHVVSWYASSTHSPHSPLPGTESTGALNPFWSPDGRSIGFFAGGKLKIINVSGGPPRTLADAPDGNGGSWSPGGTILFGTATGPLHRIAEGGGAARPRNDARPGAHGDRPHSSALPA